MGDKISAEIESFFKKYKLITYKKGETILRRDDDDNASHVFYIKKGYVRLHIYSTEGKELTAIILTPKEIFPLTLVIKDAPNIYWFESITPVDVYKAPAEDFRQFVKSDVDILMHITEQILIQLSALIYRMQHIILGKANTTVASIIWVYSKLLGVRKGDEVMLKMPITHQHISFSAGIARETTSLEIKKLEKKGIIKYKGRRIVVKDVDKLRDEAYI